MNSLTKEEAWHAATDANTEGVWNNHGSPLVYTNWGEGKPNSFLGQDEDCAVINYREYGLWSDDGLWDDQQCTDSHGYACELGIYDLILVTSQNGWLFSKNIFFFIFCLFC